MLHVILFFYYFISFAPLFATGLQNLPTLRVVVTHKPVERTLWTIQSMAEDDGVAEEERVSDAEALLACWSYLKRHRRIGNWTNYERRKAIKESLKDSANPSFFWAEDDTALLMDGDEEYDEEEEDDDDDFDIPLSELDILDVDLAEKENNGDAEMNPGKWFGEFTTFPSEPTTTRMRRSQSAKKLWMDPDFRKRWQESRWGKKRSENDKHKRLVESRVRQLPREFWGSDELASMTKEEINMAIETYVSGRNKKSASHKKALQKRKEVPKPSSDERIARNSLFAMDHETLKEQQRLRSERAKARYDTRLKNEGKKESQSDKPSRKRTFFPHGSTPQDAILRIQAKLDEKKYPEVNDVRIIMGPQRLGKRKELLKNILLELFDLRGKCIPKNLDDDDEASDKLFVTSAPIQQVGDFVIHLLETCAEEDDM